jgi:antitoxin HigA-1
MNNPPHPGEFIREVYLEPFDMQVRTVAATMDITPETLTRLLNGEDSVTPDMAQRLSRTLGRSPESWLAMQANYDRMLANQDE